MAWGKKLTSGQIARRWGVDARQVQRYCERRELWPWTRTPGGHYRVPIEVVEAFERQRGMDPARAQMDNRDARDVRAVPRGN